jgi:hypothetical protein
MKLLLFSLFVLTVLSLATAGCGEKTSTTKETTVSTPGGTTTVTTEREVETTGENPPAAQP